MSSLDYSTVKSDLFLYTEGVQINMFLMYDYKGYLLINILEKNKMK